MWGHLFFFFVLRDCVRWLAHLCWSNMLILPDKMAPSMRWICLELFALLPLAEHLP